MINTTEELPLDQLFPEFGLSYTLKNDKTLAYGLKLADKPEGVLVQNAHREELVLKRVFLLMMSLLQLMD